MAYDYSELLAQAQNWAHTAIDQGFLKQTSASELFELDLRSPEQLFATTNNQARPLIVAFIGGTGVGKSSLLNRLAGQAIAKAGIERPTSREVTLYHHQALHLNQLPANLPLDKTRVSQHENPENSHIVWIDMPDFDSVELGNKALVLQWLPHIDVLLYVVSPERYRDNKAWQLLQAEGCKHAWLFVMNQWDRAVPSQLDDFKQQLSKAGFTDPIVLFTSCTEPNNDNFSELLAQLNALSTQQTMQQMTQHNKRLRLQSLRNILQSFLQQLNQQDFAFVRQQIADHWPQTETTFHQGLAWVLKSHAETLAGRQDNKSEIKVWDDWAQTRLNDVLEDTLQIAHQSNILIKALKPELDNIKKSITKNAAQQIVLSGRQALLNPGSALQRFLLRLTAICETLLPLLAMFIVGYQVFARYYQSAFESIAYLGVDFAVHSVLLIALSWLIPFFLHKKMQPSLEKAAFSGLNKGLTQVMINLRAELEKSLFKVEQDKAICQKELLEMVDKTLMDNRDNETHAPLLRRVLLR
jgi:50S ribosome-binding GTPase